MGLVAFLDYDISQQISYFSTKKITVGAQPAEIKDWCSSRKWKANINLHMYAKFLQAVGAILEHADPRNKINAVRDFHFICILVFLVSVNVFM